MAYELDGTMYETCTCDVICPCWVGQDPDGGECDGAIAWSVESGSVDGVDVSGLTVGVLAHIPGNALDGDWKAVLFVDDDATEEQERALLEVFTGEQGGPVGDLVQVIGELVTVERAPIECRSERGEGELRIGGAANVSWEAIEGATGEPAALQDTAFSSIPGEPAFVGRSTRSEFNRSDLDMDLSLVGRSAVLTAFRYHS